MAPPAPGCHMRVRTVKHIPFNTKRPQRHATAAQLLKSQHTGCIVRMPFALQCVLYACCKDQAVTATLVKPDPHSAARKLVCVWPRYRAKSASSTIALPITTIGSALALPAIAALCTQRGTGKRQSGADAMAVDPKQTRNCGCGRHDDKGTVKRRFGDVVATAVGG